MPRSIKAPVLVLIALTTVWAMATLLATDATGSPAAAQSAGQALAVPAYFYPAGGNLAYWEQLRSASPAVSMAVATGLGLGGASPDLNYQREITKTRGAGIPVLAYVTTSAGTRPVSDVRREIDRAFAWYQVDGILFDEAVAYPVTCGQVGYYRGINDYVKAKNARATTVINHGQILPECYATVADVMINAETDADAYELRWQQWGWERNYPAGKFWHLVHGAQTVEQMKRVVALSRSRNAGHVFVTSAGSSSPGGPYGSLPGGAYWSAELAAVTSPLR